MLRPCLGGVEMNCKHWLSDVHLRNYICRQLLIVIELALEFRIRFSLEVVVRLDTNCKGDVGGEQQTPRTKTTTQHNKYKQNLGNIITIHVIHQVIILSWKS